MSKKLKIIITTISCAALLLCALVLYVVLGNTSVGVSKFTVSSDNLPSEFDGFRIVQISDLHNAEFGKDNRRLIKKIKKCEPDIIALTGDLIDSRNTDLDIAINFVKEATKIAPCYYVTGNHEGRIDDYEAYEAELIALGVIVIDNESVVIEKGLSSIELHGLHDLESLKGEKYGYRERGVLEKLLTENTHNKDGFDVLLAHYPDFLDLYSKYEYDLVLSGHAHGGQFRLPFVGGLYAPLQGKLPKYDAGLFSSGNTQMIVSRGLGNSVFPFRINNTPEVVLVTLTR